MNEGDFAVIDAIDFSNPLQSTKLPLYFGFRVEQKEDKRKSGISTVPLSLRVQSRPESQNFLRCVEDCATTRVRAASKPHAISRNEFEAFAKMSFKYSQGEIRVVDSTGKGTDTEDIQDRSRFVRIEKLNFGADLGPLGKPSVDLCSMVRLDVC